MVEKCQLPRYVNGLVMSMIGLCQCLSYVKDRVMSMAE